MRLTHVGTVLLFVVLSSCNQASQHKLRTALGLESTTMTLSSASTPWVSYTVDALNRTNTLFGEPQKIARLTDESLFETSGLAASPHHSGCLWLEEDSGNPNQIQLLNEEGSIVARFTIDGAENRDWEDITIGPGPVAGKPYIYLADIGDNKRQYREKIIYRFPEPTFAEQHLPVIGHITQVDSIRLTLPDGSQNAEAMLVDPLTKDLFILSKDDYSTVYRANFPQSVTKAIQMTRSLFLPFHLVTSAAMSADGHELLIRTYNRLFYYTRQSDESIVEMLKRAPQLLPLAEEAQGEAVGWATDGSGYYTTSEKTRSTSQSLYFYQRTP